MAKGSEYEKAVGEAAESLMSVWFAEDAGERSDESAKAYRYGIDRMVAEFGFDRRQVIRDVKRRALEGYRA